MSLVSQGFATADGSPSIVALDPKGQTMMNNGDNSLIGTNPNGINNSSIEQPAYTSGPLYLSGNPRTNGNNYFAGAAFAMNALGTPGNAKRRFFYGPGADNFDMAVGKKLAITPGKVAVVPGGGVQRLQPQAIQWPFFGRGQYRQFDLRRHDQRRGPAYSARRGQVQLLSGKGLIEIRGAHPWRGAREVGSRLPIHEDLVSHACIAIF